MHHVYQIKSGRKLLYIGKTNQPGARMLAHIKTERFPPNARMVIVKSFDRVSDALLFEAALIAAKTPPMNMTHNSLAVVWSRTMPEDEAREIWFSHPGISTRNIGRHMPGWSYGRAAYRFGPRRGDGPKHITIRQRDALKARIISTERKD